jgi:chemotaxis protein CheC
MLNNLILKKRLNAAHWEEIMLLTQKQRKSLIQFSKIGLNNANIVLSELIKAPVNISVSEVFFYPLSYLNKEFSPVIYHDFASVQQHLKGGISGNGLFVLEYPVAVDLVNLIQNQPQFFINKLNTSSYEILMEIGNIILGSYVGTLGNLTDNPLAFSLPLFQVISFDKMLDSLIVGKNEIRYVLLMVICLNLRGKILKCHLMLVSGVVGLSCLIRGIESSVDLVNLELDTSYDVLVRS